MTVSFSNGVSLGNIVTAVTDAVTGAPWLSAGSYYYAPRLAPPPPTGVVATDHLALTAFFDAAPNKAIIEFPRGADYTVFGGAIRHRPGQIINYNHCTIKRANEVATTSAGPTNYGASIVIPVTSTAGFLPGQAIAVYYSGDGGATGRIAWDCRCTAVGATDITIANGAQFLDFVTAAGSSYTTTAIPSGAIVMTRGALINNKTWMSSSAKEIVENLLIDGNRNNNANFNRWEYSREVEFYSRAGVLHNCEMNNVCGEGLVIWGDNPQVDGFRATNLNGNGIHFNSGCNDPFVNNVFISAPNLDTNIGHADGGIIASDATYRAIITQWRVKGSKRAAIGSWDQADNAYAKISQGFAEDCYIGLEMFSVDPSIDVEVSDVTVKNCGLSFVGANRTNISYVAPASRFRISGLQLIDSTAYISGLVDSDVDISVHHSDSGTRTSTNTAAGYANNYVGDSLGERDALLTISSSRRTRFNIRAFDGAASPLASKFNIKAYTQAGGPMVGCRFDLASDGNTGGISMDGVFIECGGNLTARNWSSGYTGVHFNHQVHAVDAAYVTAEAASRDNEYRVKGYYDKASPGANTFGAKTNQASGCGWLRVSGKMVFNTTPSGMCYGFSAQSATYKTRWDDVEAVGPASNFIPYQMANGGVSGDGRLNNWRSYPAPAAAGTNWVAETPSVTLIA